MDVKYDSGADAMYIRLKTGRVHRNQVVNDVVVVDLAEDGSVIGIELLSPSRYVDDLTTITYDHIPAATPDDVPQSQPKPRD